MRFPQLAAVSTLTTSNAKKRPGGLPAAPARSRGLVFGGRAHKTSPGADPRPALQTARRQRVCPDFPGLALKLRPEPFKLYVRVYQVISAFLKQNHPDKVVLFGWKEASDSSVRFRAYAAKSSWLELPQRPGINWIGLFGADVVLHSSLFLKSDKYWNVAAQPAPSGHLLSLFTRIRRTVLLTSKP
jgi:hypothetical protein